MKLSMKLLRIVGLCLVAMFAMSVATAATASAAPVWEQCTTEKTTVTKYTENKCLTASSTGAWGWKELETTEAVIGHATLLLKDTKVTLGPASVRCGGTEEGLIGPGKLDKVTKVTVVKCERVEDGPCEELKEVKPVDLPWQTTLWETAKTVYDKVEPDGNGQPGWSVECKTPLGTKTDTCTSETGKEASTTMTNKQLSGTVLASFQSTAPKGKCSEGGKEAGEVTGPVELASVAGHAIRVS